MKGEHAPLVHHIEHMAYKIGFIGGGNIATSILGGLIDSNLYQKNEIIVSDRLESSIKNLKENYGVEATQNNESLVKTSEIVLIAVKPHLIDSVLTPLMPYFTKDQLIISVAAGITTETLRQYFKEDTLLYRVMPNTPAKVRAGMSVIFSDADENEPSLKTVRAIFEAVGRVEVMDESLVHACIAVQGSSPAYMFMVLEAMGDAAVRLGLPRDKAYNMAAQSMLGSALMLLESQSHPGVLKDMVTSPKGTTIDAVASLEASGIRDSFIKAMTACAEKSEAMSKK